MLKSTPGKIIRKKKDQEKEIDIRIYVTEMFLKNGGLQLSLRLSPQGTARVEEVIQALFPHYVEVPSHLCVERTGLFIEKQGKCITPLEVD